MKRWTEAQRPEGLAVQPVDNLKRPNKHAILIVEGEEREDQEKN